MNYMTLKQYTKIMDIGFKSLDTVLDFYITLLLFVKLVFRAKFRHICFSPLHINFYAHLTKCVIHFTFHQSEYLLVSDTFNYTY